MVHGESWRRLVIGAAASEWKARGAIVAAAAPGWPRPSLVNGERPDVIAVMDSRVIVIVVETCDTIETDAARKRWEALACAGHEFHVVTPRDCIDVAWSRARLWDVDVDAFTAAEIGPEGG